MFLGCSLLVPSFLPPLFVPSRPFHGTPATPPARPAAQTHRSSYKDAGGGVKVT
jgi:hypothetical protein